MAPGIDELPHENVAHIIGMQRIDLGVLGSVEILKIVALNGFVEKRQAQGEDQEYNQQNLSPQIVVYKDQSAALLAVDWRFQRTMGLRAAVTSSTRLVRVRCGAFKTSSGFSSTSLAIEMSASTNRSSSLLPSVSVGSIIMAPRTIRGKLTV